MIPKEALMTRETTRSLDHIVGDMIAKWEQERIARKKKAKPFHPRPCITVSRDPGSGGTEIARRLAGELEMDLLGREVIQQVSERADISEKVICSIDEKEVRLRDSWLDSLFRTRHMWPDEYVRHLTKVIGTIGRQGNAIIIGRGSQFILPPEEAFRVRLIAPRETRIGNVMRNRGADRESAERYVYETEADRNAFHHKHFRADWMDPGHYDLILNTGVIGIDGSVMIVRTAFLEWKKHLPAQSSDRGR
jgi:cytidylate kinase